MSCSEETRRSRSASPAARVDEDAISGEVMWTVRRAGLSSMSTQRRASRTTPATQIDCVGIRHRWFASGLTAPLMSIVWLAWAWLRPRDEASWRANEREATNSLLSDHRNETLAWLDSRSGSPPPGGVGVRGPSVRRVTHRSSLRHASILPVRARLHPTLPHAPAGEVRWAERQDGKRDLYFQHAA